MGPGKRSGKTAQGKTESAQIVIDMFGYLFHPTVEKELARFPLPEQERIIKRIREMCKRPHPLDFPKGKKLKGYKELMYRLRVGNYRIKFVVRKPSLIYIIESEHRQAEY